MGKTRNKIKASKEPSGSKHIAAQSGSQDGSTNHLKPEFNLEHIGGRYCLSNCEQTEKAAFADRLHELGRLTWNQIQRAGRHKQGFEVLARNNFGDRHLPDGVTEEVNLLAFRFSGLKAMVGYRKDHVLVILWLDRNFTLYKH